MTDKPKNPPAFPSFQGDHRFALEGMTLRDYFASNVDVPDNLDIDTAQALTGKMHPNNQPDYNFSDGYPYLECQKFWAEAEAAYKYMRADAMLAARREAVHTSRLHPVPHYMKLEEELEREAEEERKPDAPPPRLTIWSRGCGPPCVITRGMPICAMKPPPPSRPCAPSGMQCWR